MPYIDMHCDTLMMAALVDKNKSLYSSEVLHVDYKRMKKSGAMAQFFAIFMPDEATYQYLNVKPMRDKAYFDLLFELYLQNLKAHSDIIMPAHTAQMMQENYKNGKMSAVLTMEDGRMVDSDFGKLDEFYDLGVRVLTLTWNHPNCFGYPHSKNRNDMEKGLTSFGKEAVEYMNEIGMLIDVSHLSDGGFWDVMKISKKPFVATHSNCRELSPHTRNMTDEMIRALGEKGGVMGLNFCPAFLNQDITCKDGKIQTMVDHILHIIKVGGIETAALGSDLDGMSGNLEVPDCGEYDKLFTALKKAGLSESELDKITYQNVVRVMKDTLW